jgi:Family of unknown function (DUF6178)
MTNRSVRIDRASPRQILARVLDEPSLVAIVQNLAPRRLGKLITHVGLEDSGEIISLATTEQIRQIFDDDLWRSDSPGNDEVFDADRFALWLEVMLEAGEDFVAEKLRELPEDMVTLALHRQTLVLNIDRELETEDHNDGERVDKAFANCLHEEFDEYQVISRHHDGWDSIVSVLTTLDKHDHAFLNRVLERCCHMSSEYIEDNGGLFNVLTSEETLESDLAADREDRRAGEGFIAPSQAASFFALCRTAQPKDVIAAPRDAVTRAYLRDVAPAKASHRPDLVRALPAASATDRTADLEHILAELDVDDLPRDARPAFLFEGKNQAAATGVAIFGMALGALRELDPAGHARTMEELAYLTNVLVSGCHLDDRSFRPCEAVVAVAAVCNLGLEELAKSVPETGTLAEHASERLGREGADKVFRVGFWLLHHEVALATCDAIARVFAACARRTNDVELRRAYERSAKFVREKRSQGKPTLARNRLSDLPVDEAVRAVIEGLLSECPTLGGPLVKDGSNPYQLDPKRQLVASRADLERVRAFLNALEKSDPGGDSS